MPNKPILFLFTALYCLIACKNTESEAYIPPISLFPVGEDSTNPEEPYYPFPDYITEQIQYVETNPFGIERTLKINGEMIDSAYINVEDFKKIASIFLKTNPNIDSVKPHFKETSFNDLSINRLTFTIEALDASQNLKKAEIWVNPENQKVKTVLLTHQYNHSDSSVLQHCLWFDKTHFQISEHIQPLNGKAYDRVTRVVWDKRLED